MSAAKTKTPKKAPRGTKARAAKTASPGLSPSARARFLKRAEEMIREVERDREGFKRRIDDKVRRENPHMTEAQIQESWHVVDLVFGLGLAGEEEKKP
jgi:hypothetical protein